MYYIVDNKLSKIETYWKIDIMGGKKSLDLTGKIIGNFTVLSHKDTINGFKRWNVRCSCGTNLILKTFRIKAGRRCSLWCKDRPRLISTLDKNSGKYKENLYFKEVWRKAKAEKCLSKEFSELSDFINIITNKLGKKNSNFFLKRIDNNKLFSVDNIKWVTKKHNVKICDIDYRWCTSCERYVQFIDKFWYKSRSKQPCKKCIKRLRIKRDYNLEYTDYIKMLNKCGQKCQICLQNKTLFIDHCHKFNKVRGLLCSNCNFGLGKFNDNITYVTNAINYLNRQSTNIKYKNTGRQPVIDQVCPITLSVDTVCDHSHKTGLVRGNIAEHINLALGLFKDDIENLNRAINYLRANI